MIALHGMLVPARRSRAGASDSDGGVDDGVSLDINSFIIYPSRKTYFQTYAIKTTSYG